MVTVPPIVTTTSPVVTQDIRGTEATDGSGHPEAGQDQRLPARGPRDLPARDTGPARRRARHRPGRRGRYRLLGAGPDARTPSGRGDSRRTAARRRRHLGVPGDLLHAPGDRVPDAHRLRRRPGAAGCRPGGCRGLCVQADMWHRPGERVAHGSFRQVDTRPARVRPDDGAAAGAHPGRGPGSGADRAGEAGARADRRRAVQPPDRAAHGSRGKDRKELCVLSADQTRHAAPHAGCCLLGTPQR